MFAFRFEQKGIHFEILNPESILGKFYRADIQKIRQILVNLLGNSFKFLIVLGLVGTSIFILRAN